SKSTGRMRSSTAISGASQKHVTSETSHRLPLIFSPEASPASPFRSQGEDEVRQTIATSGRRCFASYENFVRGGSSPKTFAAYLILNGAWYSSRCALTWKGSHTTFRRLLFQLQLSMPRTAETGCGLLLAPPAINIEGGSERVEKRTAFRASIGRK